MYGKQRNDGPVFISVCVGGDDEETPQIEKFIRDHGITFPVMLDSSDPSRQSWGVTCKAYGVNAIPTDAVIDAQGKLISVGDHRYGK